MSESRKEKIMVIETERLYLPNTEGDTRLRYKLPELEYRMQRPEKVK